MAIKINISKKSKNNSNTNSIPTSFKFFKKFSSKFNPVFLTYVRIIWIICIFIISYNCIIAPIIWFIKQTCLRWTWKGIFDLPFIKWPSYIFEFLVKNPYVLTIANIIFAVITVLWIVFYIFLLICLFVWSIIPWPFVTDRQAPRKWEFFKKLKDVFDVFEFKVSIFTFTIKSFVETIAIFFVSRKKNEENFTNKINKSITKLNSPYIDEIDKDFYESSKSFYEKGDTYSAHYIKAQNHNVEANIINKMIISTNKTEYDKNSFKNTFVNNGLEENIKKAVP
jgi:hypothetical protein